MRGFRSLAATAASIPITLFGLVLLTFIIGRVVPIDPVLAVVGDRAPQDVVEQTRREMGLDRPLPEQFVRYTGQLLQGDLGRSVMTSNRVATDIARFFPATLELATVALVFATALGVPLGVLAAVRQGRWVDQVIRVVCLSGHSIPVFVLALVSLLVFYATLGWAPGPGRQDVLFQDMVPQVTGLLLVDCVIAGDWDALRDAAAHLALPALVLGAFNMAYHRADDAGVHAGELARRIYRDRAGEGALGLARGVAARVRQHPGAAGDGAGAGLCRAAGGGGADRDDLQLAGPWAVP